MILSQSDYDSLLKKYFGLESFRKGQREIISATLAGKDTLAVLPTGGGKSLCYQFSAIATGKLVVVISPLIALMKDQVASLQRMGIPTGCLCSGQTESEKRKVFEDMNKGGAFVLYLSPERAQKEGFQKWIKGKNIALFAVDEAHCVSQWGHDFREEYSQLKILKALRPDVPILALTASATPTVLADIAKNLRMVNPEKLIHGFYRPNLYYQVELCADDEAKTAFLLQSLKQTPTGRIIIYCGTRKVTEGLAAFLQKTFDDVGYYHAGLSSEQRTQTQQAYTRGDLRILVATNAFGMGIDQPNVRLVVHFQMPANIDSLYQEMGRAGRDGIFSTCLMLYSKKDKGLQSFFIQNSEAPKEIKDSRWRNLETLVSYSEGGECRHSEILTYYKDSQRIQKCGHCDMCDPKSERKVLTVETSYFATKINYMGTALLKKKPKAKKSTYDQDMPPDAEQRFQSLKAWRKMKALELDVPAFVVFGDKSLRDMAIKNPSSLEELKDIYGVGESKLEKFGADLLSELNR